MPNNSGLIAPLAHALINSQHPAPIGAKDRAFLRPTSGLEGLWEPTHGKTGSN